MKEYGPAERSRLFGRAWPAGLSAEDGAEWLRLSEEGKQRAMAKLDAVLSVDDPAAGSDPMSVADAAALAGVTASRMYGLLAGWRAHGGRSLSSLGIRRRSLPRSRGKRWERAERRAKAAFDRALDRNPEVRTEDLIAAVDRLGLDPAPGRTTLYGWVMEVRRYRREGVRFGPDFVLDLAAVEATSPAGGPYGLAALVDPSSRLILGWQVQAPATSQDLRLALADAGVRLARMRLPDMPASSAEPTLRVPSLLSFLDLAMASLPPEVAVERDGDGAAWGRALVRCLGERAGPFRIHAGPPRGSVSARTGHEVELPSVEADDMRRAVDAALEAHNAAMLGLFGGEASPELLSAVDRLRRSLA